MVLSSSLSGREGGRGRDAVWPIAAPFCRDHSSCFVASLSSIQSGTKPHFLMRPGHNNHHPPTQRTPQGCVNLCRASRGRVFLDDSPPPSQSKPFSFTAFTA